MSIGLLDGWEYFDGWSEGAPARVELDMRIAEEVPIEARPWLLRVRVPSADATDAPFVAAIIKVVRRRFDAVYVARTRTDSYEEHIFHGTSYEHFKDAVRDVSLQHSVGATRARRAMVKSEHDSSWRFVREQVLPDRYQYQWIQDRRVVEAMAQGGDQIDEPRTIDHSLYFRSVEAREQFATEVQALGFETDVATDGDGMVRHGLIVRRDDPVTLDHIHDVVRDLIQRAEARGGQYDGWGAPLVNR